ncbi:MAG: response regulator [bacterium]
MKKVLVIDDEQDIVEVIRFALQEEGFETAFALDGADGLKEVERFKPDVIVLDIIMEKMDGVTFVKRLKKDIPVIVISACDSMTRERVEKEIKVNNWLEKPFEIKTLLDEVKKQLNGAACP